MSPGGYPLTNCASTIRLSSSQPGVRGPVVGLSSTKVGGYERENPYVGSVYICHSAVRDGDGDGGVLGVESADGEPDGEMLTAGTRPHALSDRATATMASIALKARRKLRGRRQSARRERPISPPLGAPYLTAAGSIWMRRCLVNTNLTAAHDHLTNLRASIGFFRAA